jgi:hypothetical protein
MRPTHTALVAALIAGAVLSGPASAQSSPEFKFSGFGTVAAVNSSQKNADFTTSVLKPNGAGYSRSVSFDPDSKLGGQVSATLTDKLTGVVQVVTQQQHDNSYTPQIEWANLKYALTPEVSVRLGRVALPAFMISDTRLVGYANPWVRTPVEVYGTLPLTSNDGIDASYRTTIAGANNTLQAFYGKAVAKLVGGGEAKGKQSWGFNDSVEMGSLQLRAGYSYGKVDITGAEINALFNGLSRFAAGAAAVPDPAFQAVATQANALVDKYKLDGMKWSWLTLGANYDPGDWFVMGEFVKVKGDSVLSDNRSFYVSGGYRFGSFTPYVSYAKTKSDVPTEGISTAGATPLAANAAGLSAGLNAILKAFGPQQNTLSAGVRWDFMRNMALKLQYDRLSLGENSAGSLTNVQPGFVPGGKVNLVSVAVDFVF